jgi:hypothetical protein
LATKQDAEDAAQHQREPLSTGSHYGWEQGHERASEKQPKIVFGNGLQSEKIRSVFVPHKVGPMRPKLHLEVRSYLAKNCD